LIIYDQLLDYPILAHWIVNWLNYNEYILNHFIYRYDDKYWPFLTWRLANRKNVKLSQDKNIFIYKGEIALIICLSDKGRLSQKIIIKKILFRIK